MKLIYTIEMADLVVFNQYNLDHSDFLKSRRRKSIALICVIYGVIGINHSLAAHSVVPIIVWSLFALVFSLWFSRANRRSSPKRIQKLFGSDKNKHILCQHELELVDDGIIERTPFGEHRTTYPGIEKVAQIDTHGFIFIGTMSAHLIPKKRVTEGDFDAFMRTISERWESQQKDV